MSGNLKRIMREIALKNCPAPPTKNARKSGWVCSCGKRLPTTGRVWARRYSMYTPEEERAGYYCDRCADARESGIDY